MIGKNENPEILEIAKLKAERLRCEINVEIIRQQRIKANVIARTFAPYEVNELIDSLYRIEEINRELAENTAPIKQKIDGLTVKNKKKR